MVGHLGYYLSTGAMADYLNRGIEHLEALGTEVTGS